MATFVKIEGRDRIPVPDEIRNDDGLIIKALSPYYPQVAEAELRRTTEGDDTVISITPIGKTKGLLPLGPVVAALDRARPYNSAAVALANQLRDRNLTDDDLLVNLPAIDDALRSAQADLKAVEGFVAGLDKQVPDGPSVHVPLGF